MNREFEKCQFCGEDLELKRVWSSLFGCEYYMREKAHKCKPKYYLDVEFKPKEGIKMEENKEKFISERNAVIKEFAENLKELLTGWCTDPTDEEIEYTIDNLVREMTDDENDR